MDDPQALIDHALRTVALAERLAGAPKAIDHAHLARLSADVAELEEAAERLRPRAPVMQSSALGLVEYWRARDAVIAARDHRYFVSRALTSWVLGLELSDPSLKASHDALADRAH